MKYLLDTHTLLWIVNDSENLSEKVANIYLDNSSEIYLSTASLWEMATKISLKKLTIGGRFSNFVDKHVLGNNIQILNVTPEHIYPLVTLPYHHRDPFDRLIISQCLQENMLLLSKDEKFDQYHIQRVW